MEDAIKQAETMSKQKGKIRRSGGEKKDKRGKRRVPAVRAIPHLSARHVRALSVVVVVVVVGTRRDRNNSRVYWIFSRGKRGGVVGGTGPVFRYFSERTGARRARIANRISPVEKNRGKNKQRQRGRVAQTRLTVRPRFPYPLGLARPTPTPASPPSLRRLSHRRKNVDRWDLPRTRALLVRASVLFRPGLQTLRRSVFLSTPFIASSFFFRVGHCFYANEKILLVLFFF